MGKKYTKKETDFWGNEKEVHYEDGKKVGETKHRETFWGNKVQDHYDASGDKIGETRREDGLFGDKAVHYDADKNKIGSTKDDETLFGNKIQRHYDKSGDQVGKSHYEEGIFSGRKKVHDGEYFKGKKDESRDKSVNTSYDSSSYSSGYSSSEPYASSSSKTSSNSAVWELTILILAYIAILVSFSILLPDLWKKYWGRQEFFWISLVFLIIMAMIGKPKGLWLKFVPMILFGLILFLYVREEWPKPEKDGNNSNIVAEDAVQQDSNTDVRTIKIVAHPDKWVKVKIPYGHDWQFDSNPAYGLENTKTLVAVKINSDEKSVKYSGMLQDGSISNAFFQIQARCVEFKSEDKNPAYLLVHLTKK